MTFAEIVKEIISREYRCGNTEIYDPWAATLQAASEILEGYRDEADAQDELAWLRAPLNTGCHVRYTGMGYEFDAETLKLALALRRCHEMCDGLLDTDPERTKRELEFLYLQHPNPWDNSVWYPAVTASGRFVEIKRTTGRGRVANTRYLHVRREAEIVSVQPDGNKKPIGTMWVHFRANLETGVVREI